MANLNITLLCLLSSALLAQSYNSLVEEGYCERFNDALGVGTNTVGRLLLIARNNSTSKHWQVYEGNFSKHKLQFDPPVEANEKWPELFINENFQNLYEHDKQIANVNAITMAGMIAEIWFVVLNDHQAASGVRFQAATKSVFSLKLKLKFAVKHTFLSNQSLWVSSSIPDEFYLINRESASARITKMKVTPKDWTATERQTLTLCTLPNNEIIFAAPPQDCSTIPGSHPFNLSQLQSALAFKRDFSMFTDHSLISLNCTKLVANEKSFLEEITFSELCKAGPPTTTIAHPTKILTNKTVKTTKTTKKDSTRKETSRKGHTTKRVHSSSWEGNVSTAQSTEMIKERYIFLVGAVLLLLLLAFCCYGCFNTKMKKKENTLSVLSKNNRNSKETVSKPSKDALKLARLAISPKKTKKTSSLVALKKKREGPSAKKGSPFRIKSLVSDPKAPKGKLSALAHRNSKPISSKDQNKYLFLHKCR